MTTPGEAPASGVGHTFLQQHLRMDPAARPDIYRQVAGTSEFGDLSYWIETLLSAGIATLGLVENSPAVVIGAMLISPLMNPIMATGLALATGDLYLGIKAVLKLVISIAAAIALAALLTWLLPFHSATPEILARTTPNLLDLGIALFSGLAGSIALCRATTDKAGVLPGVAISVALMPPLCTMGFGLGSGLNFGIAGGAGLLFLTNLVAIVASAFVIFLLVGMNALNVREKMMALRGEGALARTVSFSSHPSTPNGGGLLRWRVLMILILLAAIAVPLRRALLQVASETVARSAVQAQVKGLASDASIVSQQISLNPAEIAIHLVSTRRIPQPKLDAAKDELIRRTGRRVDLTVDTVASNSELAELMARMNAPASLPPPVRATSELQKDLLDRLRPALLGVWPSADAPIQDFDVAFGDTGSRVDVRYLAAADLGPVPLGMVTRSLRKALDLPDLTLTAQRIQPTAAPKTNAAAPRRRK